MKGERSDADVPNDTKRAHRKGGRADDGETRPGEAVQVPVEHLLVVPVVRGEHRRLPAKLVEVLGPEPCAMPRRQVARWKVRGDEHQLFRGGLRTALQHRHKSTVKRLPCIDVVERCWLPSAAGLE